MGDGLFIDPPVLMPSRVLIGTLISHCAATRPAARARTKQMMAFLRDGAPIFERERLRRESPSVNGPRYPAGAVRDLDSTDEDNSLFMDEMQMHSPR